MNVSEAVSVGTSLSLPVAEDQDAGVNGRLEYQLLPAAGSINEDAGDDVFQLVQRLNVAEASTELQLVLKTALDREQVHDHHYHRYHLAYCVTWWCNGNGPDW